MVVRRSVSFDDDVLALIENYRRKQDKIPSFSKAVNTLIRKASAKT
jgi:predicted transcriptional regulator